MGTINYGTSDYITMGIRPYDAAEMQHDPDFVEYINATAVEYGTTPETELDNYIMDSYDADYENAAAILDNYNFYYFHITIKPGYYEGLYLEIENNFPVFYDDIIEKKEAQKEITDIKKMLIDLAGVGFVACTPGWCTGYADYKGTLKAINAAIKEIRTEARFTPCYRTYARAEMI